MKRILLMFVIISASWGSAFSQQLMKAPFELRNVKESGAKIPSADNYFAIGYCTEVTPVLNGGLGSSSGITATVLIKIPAATISRFVGDSICALDMGICGNISNVVAVVRETANGANIVSKSFNATLGWNRIRFDKSIKIENKDYYVGYSVSLSSGQYAIGTSSTTMTKDALIIVNNSSATDYTSSYGALLVKALLLGNEAHFSNLGEINDFTLNKYQVQNNIVDFPVKVFNKGINKITSLEITYKYATKSALTIPFNNLNILTNTSSIVTIPQVLLDVSGNIDFTITKINGQVFTSNTITKPVVVYNPADVVPRKVLLEQFTTEKCVYCPEGTTRIKSVLDKTENINKVFWIAHHAGYYTDSYTISASSSYTKFFGGSGTYAPAMMLDRTVFDELNMGGIPVTGVGSEAEIESYVTTALSIPAFITVNILQNNPTITADNNVNITVSGEYKGTLPSEDLYVFVYLSEDGLTTTTQSGFTGTFTHNNVIRVSLGGTSGKKITWNGNKYSVNFAETLNSIWKKENMNVTAFVAKNYTEAITNVNIMNTERQRLSLVGNGQDNTLVLSKNTLSLNSEINSSNTINIASNISWTASSNQTWLSVSPASGTNNGTLTLKAISANTGLTARLATVTVSGTGVAPQTITVTQSGIGPDITSGLVAYYPFNGNANDESGNGNNGTLGGGAILTTDKSEISNKACNFGGYDNTSFLKTSNSTSLQFSNELTISLFAKINSATGMDGWGAKVTEGNHCLFAKNADWSGFYALVFPRSVDSTGIGFNIKGTNADVGVNVKPFNLTAWNHYAFTVSSSEAAIYLNGTKIKAKAISSPNFTTANANDLYFGRFISTWYPFNGKMDDIRIYNRSLSATEINRLFTDFINPTGLNNVNVLSPELQLYPNPVNTFLYISSPETLQRIEVCDIAGRLIIANSINSDHYTLLTDNLVGGVYIVKGFTRKGIITGRFMKE